MGALLSCLSCNAHDGERIVTRFACIRKQTFDDLGDFSQQRKREGVEMNQSSTDVVEALLNKSPWDCFKTDGSALSEECELEGHPMALSGKFVAEPKLAELTLEKTLLSMENSKWGRNCSTVTSRHNYSSEDGSTAVVILSCDATCSSRPLIGEFPLDDIDANFLPDLFK